MKKQIFGYILIICILVSLSCVFASGSGDWFVNDAFSVLPKYFEGVYAIGGDGTAPLSQTQVYALSAGGLQPLGTAVSTGGGGLNYTDGNIAVASDLVRVGLNYYYSASRDNSISAAALENAVGSGFAFGTLNADGSFEELERTELQKISILPVTANGIWVCAPGSSDPLFTFEASSRENYLIVHPLAEDEETEAVTWYAQRKYYGDFGYACLGNGKLTVVNCLDLEHYVMGVCACEMTESWPVEALKAQAVAARTYVQKMIRNSVYYYTCGFDVTADTYCQAYLGCGNVGPRITAAVTETANQYLTYQGALADALYSAADGGATESNINVFGNNAHPYLTGIYDPYEAAADAENPYSSWTVTMTPAQLGAKVGLDYVRSVTPTFSNTGNVIRLDFVSRSGQTATIIRDSCRTVLGLKNIRYTISVNADGNFVFTGSGFGHNLGMSQWGAYAMAKYYEKDYRSILGFYYTGVGLSYGILE